MIAVKTCGKLYWAGEYAILEPGQLALIKAIPIYMKGEIAFSDSYRIYSDMFDFAVDLTPNPDYSLIQETIALVENFLANRGQTLRPFFFGNPWKNGTRREKSLVWVLAVVSLSWLSRLYWLCMMF